MKTEQIVSYLLVSTVIVIFAMLVLFTMTASAGNGGEYWGYDGRVEPLEAASAAFEDGDYRFLDVTLSPYNDKLTDFTPGVMGCEHLPDEYMRGLRSSTGEPLHGVDSLRLATDFARAFNRELAFILNSRLQARCVIAYDR